MKGSPVFKNYMSDINSSISERLPKVLTLVLQQLADNCAAVKDQLDGSISNSAASVFKLRHFDVSGTPASIDVGEEIGTLIGGIFFENGLSGGVGVNPTTVAVDGSVDSQINLGGAYTATDAIIFYIAA